MFKSFKVGLQNKRMLKYLTEKGLMKEYEAWEKAKEDLKEELKNF